MAPKVLTTEHSWNKKRKLERQEKTFRNFGKLYDSKCQSRNTDANENNIQNGVQQVNFAESNNKIAKLTTKTLKDQRQKILETSSINQGIQKPHKGRNSNRNEELIKILFSPKNIEVSSRAFKFILIFAHAFSARAIMITHTAFDWLFRHALLSIKTSTSFLKGSNRVIAYISIQ